MLLWSQVHCFDSCLAWHDSHAESALQIAVRAVESEQTKLDRVLKLLGFLHQHFSGVLDGQVKKVMLDGLEKRFADYDQPALLIAYMLNPQRQQQFLNPNCDFVSWRNAVILVELLYIRFFPDATDASKSAVANQFLSYINKEDPFDESKLQTVIPASLASTQQCMQSCNPICLVSLRYSLALHMLLLSCIQSCPACILAQQ